MTEVNDKFHEEEEQWYANFLNIQYYDLWKKNHISSIDNVPSIEFTLSRKCNLKCTYCYYTRHGKELYPDNIDKVNPSIDNCEKILNYLTREKMTPMSIEIFGGEAVSAKQYLRLFDLLYEYSKKLPPHLRDMDNKGAFFILFPLNVIFLEDQEYFDLLVNQQHRFLEIGIKVLYSISFDGKYCDPISRPAYDSSFKYDDAFYARVAEFCRTVPLLVGFHPMISQDNIKYWKENLDWFIDYIKSTYSLNSRDAMKFLYLLEVRNEDWSQESIEYLSEFLFYLVGRVYSDPEICNKDRDVLYSDLIEGHMVNLAGNIAGYIPRGLTCSLQTAMYVRTGDLTIIPCHRLSYEPFLAGKFEVSKDGEMTGRVITEFPYMHLAAVTNNFHNHPVCAKCEIRSFCPGPCLGANYEATKDPFIESPAMCRMEKTKTITILHILNKYGILSKLRKTVRDGSDGPSDYNGFMLSKYTQLENLIHKYIEGDKK